LKKHPIRNTSRAASVLLALCVATIPFSFAKPAPAEEVLQVFLQGSSADEIAAEVERHGGKVTHHLPIIDAVGAKVTGPALADIVESEAVHRFIDDLADSEVPGEPQEEERPPCRVRGSIELDFTPEGISWRLYNKHEETATMQSLSLGWPASLGDITSISVGGETIDPALHPATDAPKLDLTFAENRGPKIDGMERLDIAFTTAPGAAKEKVLQRDFDLEAGFVGPCSTDLVPGYENNHEDYYYNTAGGVDELHKQGLTGKGVTIAVVDSGLWEHELLRNNTQGENRLLATYDAITDTEGGEAVDESGHGTHMTSIIANSGKTLKNGVWTGTYKGVAPDANIVAVKVLDRQGLAHMLDIVRGVQWVVENREVYGIDVMNLSFVQQPLWDHSDDPVNQAILIANRLGIIGVAAAGNNGPNADTIGAPGNSPSVITVGLLTDSWTPLTSSDDYIPPFSSVGSTTSEFIKPDLVALGAHMTGLSPPGSQLSQFQPEDFLSTGEFVSTGTSQAAAFVSGLIALIKPIFPKYSAQDVHCAIVATAEPAILSSGLLAYPPNKQGRGRASAIRAVLLGRSWCSPPFRASVDTRHQSDLLATEDHQYLSSQQLKDLWTPTETSGPIQWGIKAWVESLLPNKIDSIIEASPASTIWLQRYEEEKKTVGDIR
jgi:subtilisin family serine protease